MSLVTPNDNELDKRIALNAFIIFISATRIDNELSLHAVYSRTRIRAQIFANKFNVTPCYTPIKALSQDKKIEAVYIPSPNSLHFEQAMLMLKAGKHVICEKTSCSNSKQIKLLYKTALQNNVFCILGLFDTILTKF